MKFSSLNRIYTISSLNRTDNLTFEGDNAHYLRNVLRIRLNEQIRIFNQAGEFTARVVDIARHQVVFTIGERIREPNIELPLTLGLSLIKNDRFIEAIKMAVQLGVSKIIPVVSERCSLHNINQARIYRCIIEAVEQSERFSVPELAEVTPLNQFNSQGNFTNIIYANEQEAKISIKDLDLSSSNIALIVGPEGGFTIPEIKMMSLWPNAYSVSLGNNILRCETAVAAILAQVNLMR